MRPVKQKVFSEKKGDCMRACIASILEIENDDSFYKVRSKGWIIPIFKKLNSIGLILGSDKEKIWRSGYWIANVPSKNFKDTKHAIVMKGTRVAFDPSTHRKYKTGLDLLGKDLVSFGYWIEIDDFSKLKEFLKK